MRPTVRAIARKDFADAARSRLLWGAIVVLLVVSIPDYLAVLDSPIIDSVTDAVEFIPNAFIYYVAPIAILAAHRSVVGERESGSLRLVFGHPATRRDFLVGKLLGRATLLAAVLFVATLGIGATIAVSYGTLDVSAFVAMTAYTVLYAVVWAGITVGVSAAVTSRLQALTVLLGLFLCFGPFRIWDRLAVPLFSLLFTGSASPALDPLRPSTWPAWYPYVQRVNPMSNYELGRYYFVRLFDPTTAMLGNHAVNLFGLAMLVAWFALPLALGYWRFERADLG